jgi:hypothetical protein
MDIHSGEDERSLQAVATKGLIFQAYLTPFTAEVIRRLDGSTCLREAVQKAGREMDEDPTFLLGIQTLLGLGMLAPSPAR